MRSAERPLRAVLFDVDGTLVDSNYLHIDAWGRAFRKLGVPIDGWRIHRRLGMDSAQMLEELLGDDAEQLSSRASDAHAHFYRKNADRLRAFAGASTLLRELGGHGIRTVLATSASSDELDMLVEALGVGDDGLITTNADDVARAKPHPGLVEVALERADVAAGDAVFVGDSVWDMIAAKRAGVATIGVLSGGISAGELSDAGADRIVESVAELVGMTDVPESAEEEGI